MTQGRQVTPVALSPAGPKAEARLNQGVAAFNAGDAKAAIAHFTAALKAAPAYAAALLFRAAAYETAGRSREAEKDILAALVLQPDSVPLHLKAAQMLFIHGDCDAALAHCARALRLDAACAEATALRGKIESSLTAAPAAPKARAAKKEKESRSPAQALAQAGRYAEAAALTEKFLDAKPENLELKPFLSPAGQGLSPSRREKRLRALDAALERPGASPLLLYYRARLVGGPDGLALLEELKAAPAARYGWLLCLAGLAHLEAGNFAEAAARLREGLRLPPRDWRAHAWLAEAALCLGDEALAREEIAAAAKAAGRRGEALAWEGKLALWQGRAEAAFALFKATEELHYSSPSGWAGGAAVLLGRPQEALRLLAAAAKNRGADPESRVWRAQAHMLLGRDKEALRDLGEPRDAWGVLLRALARARLKDDAGMRADFWTVESSLTAKLKKAAGLPQDRVLTLAETRRVLEGALALAKGFRRDDYGQAVWLKR